MRLSKQDFFRVCDEEEEVVVVLQVELNDGR